MPRKSARAERAQNPSKLAELIRNALREQNMGPGEAADRAQLHRSHLSKVIATPPSRSLTMQQAIALANVLHISKQQLLGAAGYVSTDELQMAPGNVAIPTRSRTGFALKFVADPRFVDSVLFLYLASIQPFRAVGLDVECQLIRADWNRVVEEVASHEYSVGFYNRSLKTAPDDRAPSNVRHWGDLTRYQAYSLLAHPKHANSKRLVTIEKAVDFLKHLREDLGRKINIVCMGADTVWQLDFLNLYCEAPFFSENNLSFRPYSNADLALREFLAGGGDLFIGGLPQAFVAEEKGCQSVLSSKLHPVFFSLNSLICSDQMFTSERALLFSILSLWYGFVERLKNDEEYVEKVSDSILGLLRDLGVQDHNHSAEYFKRVLLPPEGTAPYEIFAEHPTTLLDDVIRSILKARQALGKNASLDPLLELLDLYGERITPRESTLYARS